MCVFAFRFLALLLLLQRDSRRHGRAWILFSPVLIRLWERLLMCFVQSLQAAVQRVHTYVQGLEEKIVELERKKK